jgi:sortase A
MRRPLRSLSTLLALAAVVRLVREWRGRRRPEPVPVAPPAPAGPSAAGPPVPFASVAARDGPRSPEIDTRRRKMLRRLLRSLSTVLIAAGILLIADAIIAVAWQEPVSAYLAQRSQNRLERDLDSLRGAGPSALEVRALESLPTQDRQIAYLAHRLRSDAGPGDALGRIVLPTLGKRFVIVNGDAPGDLRKGPGVYPETPLPGEGGTTGIAGHRTTYLAPFRNIDRLDRGDLIELQMPYASFTYVVQRHEIVKPTEVSVIKPVGYERIVLTACHPLYSAAQRIVVFARLAKVVPTRRISDTGAAAASR